MSRGTIRTVYGVLLSVCMLYACTGALGSPEEKAATQTARAIDVVAAQTMEAMRDAPDTALPASPVAVPTSTALPATATPRPTKTPWPEPVFIQVSIDTNCRSGPGSAFPMIGALMVGERAIVRARSSDGDYWIVENPDNPGRECWLWGRHATLVGATDQLPLITPPWTATPEPGTIAGWAYLDVDTSWTRDFSVDMPLSGVELTLRTGECPGGTAVALVKTDAQGRYQISNLMPALYCLSRDESQPLNPNTWSLLITPGQFRDEINFFQLP